MLEVINGSDGDVDGEVVFATNHHNAAPVRTALHEQLALTTPQERKEHIPARPPVRPREPAKLGRDGGNDGLGHDAHLLYKEEFA
jgi:hypothetical protein